MHIVIAAVLAVLIALGAGHPGALRPNGAGSAGPSVNDVPGGGTSLTAGSGGDVGSGGPPG